jgi:acetyltransferase-like isoleucine patch superfamily enzyme
MVPVRVGYFQGPRLASWCRKRWVRFRNPHVEIRFGRHVYLGPGFSLHAPYGGSRFIVGDGVEFRRGFRVELEPGAVVEIGNGTRFTYYVLVQCGRRIEIGQRCMFGQSSMVVDGNHRYRDLTMPMLEQGYDLRPVVMEDDAVVTTKCTIVGARIGKRAFIGANSVVSRDIPPYTVAVGAPAKPIDYFGPPGKEPAELVASRSKRYGATGPDGGASGSSPSQAARKSGASA